MLKKMYSLAQNRTVLEMKVGISYVYLETYEQLIFIPITYTFYFL